MKKNLEWYGVRTFYRASAVGKPLGKDALYSPDVTLVESRVVVFRALDPKDALRQTEREAKKYAADCRHRNPYGQWVKCVYLDCCLAYDMNDPLVAGTEVYSETEVVSKKISNRQILRRILGPQEPNKVHASRRNVCNLVFSGTAPGVRPTPKERTLGDKLDSYRK